VFIALNHLRASSGSARSITPYSPQYKTVPFSFAASYALLNLSMKNSGVIGGSTSSNGSPEMLEELDEKLDRYNLSYETVAPKNEQTIKKFQKQKLYTDTGIEITIPMEEYRNPDHVEFITNMDGTISVLIKNIGMLSSK